MAESLYLLDGHAQIYRAYYAPFRDLTSPTGEPTRATYVFMSMLFNLIKLRSPDYLAMALDAPNASDSRRALFSDYKATREPPPEDFQPQVERILSTMQTMGIPVISASGFEADDVLATLAARLSSPSLEVFLVSRDKDLDQLIAPHVKLYDPTKDEVIDAAALQAAKGYHPGQAVEIQSLTGDKVDNIPGIEGVGPKTAAKLISKYGTAEAVMQHAEELTPKLKERVRGFATQLPLTRALVTLRNNLDCTLDLEQARFSGVPADALRPIFSELGFTRLVTQLDSVTPAESAEAADVQRSASARSVEAAVVSYDMVNTPEQLARLGCQLRTLSAFAFDTETTGLNPVSARLAGVSVSWQAGQAAYIPILGLGGATLSAEEVVTALRPAFEDQGIIKCGHNIKYDLIVLAEAGLDTQGRLFDSMVASFLLDPVRRSHSLDWLAREFCAHDMIPISDLIGKGRDQTTIDQVDISRTTEYAAEDADYTWRLYERLAPELADAGFEPLFEQTEMPLVRVLVRMERNGVALDTGFLAQMGATLEGRRGELVRQVQDIAGRSFNLDSPKQLAEVLYDEQGFRVVRKTKTGRSTDAETLHILANETGQPLPQLILEYRELSKLKNTYIDSLPTMVCPKTDRVHGSYNMIGAVTGRLSSNDPNLQNIPVRTEVGRQIRRAFIAGAPQHVLLTADYSQIELRLLAHYCKDRALMSAFEEGRDIHQFVAAEIFEVDLEGVTSEQRSRAKAVNFGIIYGQSAFGLSRTTSMSVGDAREFIELYFRRYPGIQEFIDHCVEVAEQDGFATTLLGRRRPIPELRSRNRQQRQLGERLAINTVLQGSAADLIKKAMIRIHERIDDDPAGPRMLIQVHDELVFEVHREQAEGEAHRIAADMISAVALDVPLVVDTGWGANWLEGKSGG